VYCGQHQGRLAWRPLDAGYQPLEIEYWSKPDQIGHPQC